MNKPRKPRFSIFSTAMRDFNQEARKTPDYSFFDWLHGFIYLRFPYLYIGIGTGEHPLAKFYKKINRLFSGKTNNRSNILQPPAKTGTVADGYHGKVVTTQSAKRLVRIEQDIKLPNLEKIIPYERARDIILKNPQKIAVIECPCRSSRPNPCKPLDVCLIIGDPFASLVVEQHPQKSRLISSAEAERILEEEHERGHVHHAFFKDAMLNRFYAICNCCSCCCGAMQAWQNGTPMLSSSGYVSQIDASLCTGCGTCETYCQFNAIEINIEGYAVVNRYTCMGCGVCVSHCPEGAPTLVRDATKPQPLEIEKLLPV